MPSFTLLNWYCEERLLDKMLLVDCAKGVFMKIASNNDNTFTYDFWKKENQINLHEAAKSSDLLLICSSKNINRIIADDIWHMLRNKIVISAAPELSLKSLRDMYPLSKVARCALGLDADSEKSLVLISTDSDFLDTDLARVKTLLGPIGDVLVVKEELFEAILLNIKRSVQILVEIIRALRENTNLENTLYEYILGWVLYGVGSAAIKGNQLEDVLPKSSSADKVSSLIKEAVKEASIEKRK